MDENPFLNTQAGIDELQRLFDERRFAEVAEKASAMLKENPYLSDVESYYTRAVETLNAEPFVEEQMKEAESCFSNREYLKAIAAARKVLDLDSTHKRAQEILETSQHKIEAEPFIREITLQGEELFSRGEVERARSVWLKIETVDPGNPDLPLLLNRCETIRFVKKYTGEEQETIERLMKEGQQNLDEGRYQEAINIWSRILLIDETHQAGIEAIAGAKRLLEEQQREIDEMLHRARNLHAQGLAEEALDVIETVLKRSPEHPEAMPLAEKIRYEIEQQRLRVRIEGLLEAARSNLQERNWAAAAQKVSEVLQLQPGNSEAAEVNEAIQAGKRREQAEERHRHALEHHKGGNNYLAFNEVRKALELDPEYSDAIALSAEIEASLAAEQPVETDLELEAVEEAPGSVRPPAPPPAQPLSSPVISEAAPMEAPTPGWKFLMVSGLVLVAGVALLLFVYINRDKIFSSLNGSIDAPRDVDVASAGPTPIPSAAEGYMLQGQRLTSQDEPLDAIYFLQKVPPDSPLYEKASALISKAQQEILDIPSPTETPAPAGRPVADVSAAEARKAMAEGRTSFASDNFEKASQSFQRALALSPSSAEARSYLFKCYYNIGILAMREANINQADESFRKALEYAPNDEDSRRQLTVTRRYRNQEPDYNFSVYVKLQHLRE